MSIRSCQPTATITPTTTATRFTGEKTTAPRSKKVPCPSRTYVDKRPGGRGPGLRHAHVKSKDTYPKLFSADGHVFFPKLYVPKNVVLGKIPRRADESRLGGGDLRPSGRLRRLRGARHVRDVGRLRGPKNESAFVDANPVPVELADQDERKGQKKRPKGQSKQSQMDTSAGQK